MKNIVKIVINHLRAAMQLGKSSAPVGVIYRLTDINPDTLIVVLKCLNSSALLKDKLPKIINDKDILSGLEPIEACWLGYYYGKAIQKKSGQEKKKLESNVSLLMQNKRGKLLIYSFNRGGTISYLDTETKLTITEDPLLIAKNPDLINQFDPTQACYIGILSGLQIQKDVSKELVKPVLWLVK